MIDPFVSVPGVLLARSGALTQERSPVTLGKEASSQFLNFSLLPRQCHRNSTSQEKVHVNLNGKSLGITFSNHILEMTSHRWCRDNWDCGLSLINYLICRIKNNKRNLAIYLIFKKLSWFPMVIVTSKGKVVLGSRVQSFCQVEWDGDQDVSVCGPCGHRY